jgi:hypothetical protein
LTPSPPTARRGPTTGHDLSLLTEKVEVEAVGPQRLREAVVTAIEDALDLDALEQGRRDEQAQQERVGKMCDRLAELGDEELS